MDPALLASTGARLRDAVAVAEEVAARKGELAALADDAGDDRLTATIHDFLGTWAHGLGCLVEDAGTLAGLLADSGRVYLQVETGIAAAATPGGGP